MQNSYPVVIVGAGPVGVTAATLLAQYENALLRGGLDVTNRGDHLYVAEPGAADRWQQLKDYLGGEIADYLRCAGEADASGDRKEEAYWNALARAGRQALAKMAELEQ